MEQTPMIITSRQNQYVTLAAKLQERKHRQSEGLLRFDGVKLYCEAVLRGVEIEFILLDATLTEAVDAKAKAVRTTVPTLPGSRSDSQSRIRPLSGAASRSRISCLLFIVAIL